MTNILVIDDNGDLRAAICLALERAGFAVTGAEDGEAGRKHLAQTTFDLVITDIVMPGTDGLELIFSLRKEHPALPVIAISGGGRMTADIYLKFARTGGACHTLQKPFLLSELVGLAREATSRTPVAGTGG